MELPRETKEISVQTDNKAVSYCKQAKTKGGLDAFVILDGRHSLRHAYREPYLRRVLIPSVV